MNGVILKKFPESAITCSSSISSVALYRQGFHLSHSFPDNVAQYFHSNKKNCSKSKANIDKFRNLEQWLNNTGIKNWGTTLVWSFIHMKTTAPTM